MLRRKVRHGIAPREVTGIVTWKASLSKEERLAAAIVIGQGARSAGAIGADHVAPFVQEVGARGVPAQGEDMIGEKRGPTEAARAGIQNTGQAGVAGFGKQMAAWAKRAGVGEAVSAIGKKFAFKDMVGIGGRKGAEGAAPIEEGQGGGPERIAVQKGVGVEMSAMCVHGLLMDKAVGWMITQVV